MTPDIAEIQTSDVTDYISVEQIGRKLVPDVVTQ